MASSRTGRALELDLPAVAVSCPQAGHAIRAALAATAVELEAVELAVTEAVTNVVVHAYRDRDASDEPGRVQVLLDLDATGATMVVIDNGVGMTPRADSPGLGMGLALITNLCDELDIEQPPTGPPCTCGSCSPPPNSPPGNSPPRNSADTAWMKVTRRVSR